jgi:hypothetical protein
MSIKNITKIIRTEQEQTSTNLSEIAMKAFEGQNFDVLGISINNYNPFRVRGTKIYHAGTVIPLGFFNEKGKFIIDVNMVSGTPLEQALFTECDILTEKFVNKTQNINV